MINDSVGIVVVIDDIRVVYDLIIENSCIRVRHVAQNIRVCIVIVVNL